MTKRYHYLPAELSVQADAILAVVMIDDDHDGENLTERWYESYDLLN